MIVVVNGPGRGNEEIQCDKLQEGEHGLSLYAENPTTQIGYVTYDNLLIVRPEDQ